MTRPRPLLRRVRRIATPLWIVLVVAAAAWFAVGQWGRISRQVADLDVGGVVLAGVLVLAAKAVLAENARLAAVTHGVPVGAGTAFRLYNLSQLGKYVPGAVWQYVGRAAAYRELGARPAQIRDALLTETLWVTGAAVVLGSLLAGPGVWRVVEDAVDGSQAVLWSLVGVGILAAVVIVVALVLARRSLAAYARAAVPGPRAGATLVLAWLLLGASFVVTARAAGVPVSWAYGAGLFAVAYGVGVVVLLAPAGLGVREAVLTVGLLPLAPAPAVLVAVVVARLVYVAVELVIVAGQEAVVAVRRRRAVAGGSS